MPPHTDIGEPEFVAGYGDGGASSQALAKISKNTITRE
jgi:hypothetical protein